jgi:hypothetical protein
MAAPLQLPPFQFLKEIYPENGFLDRMTGCKGFIGMAPDVV